MAVIRINDLNVRGIIGTHPWERANKQDLIVNIIIEYDSSKAGKSDALKDALNYEAVSAKVVKAIEGSRFQLLEKLATRLLAVVMNDKRVQHAAVRLDKPHAVSLAQSVSFELSADRF